MQFALLRTIHLNFAANAVKVWPPERVAYLIQIVVLGSAKIK